MIEPFFFVVVVAANRVPLTHATRNTTSFTQQVVEIDACRFDPLVVVRDSGCLSYDPMDSLSDIGFLNVPSLP